jgi:hypothetical protein
VAAALEREVAVTQRAGTAEEGLGALGDGPSGREFDG